MSFNLDIKPNFFFFSEVTVTFYIKKKCFAVNNNTKYGCYTDKNMLNDKKAIIEKKFVNDKKAIGVQVGVIHNGNFRINEISIESLNLKTEYLRLQLFISHLRFPIFNDKLFITEILFIFLEISIQRRLVNKPPAIVLLCYSYFCILVFSIFLMCVSICFYRIKFKPNVDGCTS